MKNLIVFLFLISIFSCKKEEKATFNEPQKGDLVIEVIRNSELLSHINFKENTKPNTKYFLDNEKKISFIYEREFRNEYKISLKIQRNNEVSTYEKYYEELNGIMISDIDNDGIKEITVSEDYFANRDFQTEYHTYSVVKK